jgi:hypothetical protein
MPKLPVSVLKQKKQNKHLISDSSETSFGCFNTKLVSKSDILLIFKEIFIATSVVYAMLLMPNQWYLIHC